MSKNELASIDDRWRPLCRAAGWSGLAVVSLIPVQVLIFALYPPPTSVESFFALLQERPLLGLLSLDLLYLLSNTLLGVFYPGLWNTLRRTNESAMALSLLLGVLGIGAYYASNTCFEMLSLSGQWAAAVNEQARAGALAAGSALLAIYQGTAFTVYYVLNAAALLLLAGVMFRSRHYAQVDAWFGLVAGLLMLVPSTAGAVGLVLALASLLPWIIFSVLVARRLLWLGRATA